MSGSRGLSLRTRLLLLQIAVTALFLLVMGVVSTIFFARHLTSQFNAAILAESTRSPAEIERTPGAGALAASQLAAVQVTFTPFTVHPLTRPSLATEALLEAVTRLPPEQLRRYGQHATLFKVASAGLASPQLTAAARLIPPRSAASPRQASVLVVAERSTALSAQLRGLILAEMITGGVLITLLAAGGQWLIGRGLDPLHKMARTANDITARGDLTERMAQEDSQTEVGQLGAAINTMLDRTRRAFGARLNSERKVREFAADASHELRTPLTTIRGYAELYRQGALGPEDQLTSVLAFRSRRTTAQNRTSY